MLFTTSLLADSLIIILVFYFLLYKYATRKFDYWKIRDVYHYKPTPFLGNFSDIIFLRETTGLWIKKLYDCTDKPYFGIFIYDEPCLIIKSPELAKNILIKDFNYFIDRTISCPKHNEAISHMIFFQDNPKWKSYRTKSTAIFSSGRLKGMFPIIVRILDDYGQYINDQVGAVEAKDVCSRFTMEVISQCCFGMKANCFDKKDSMFRKMGNKLFDTTARNAIIQNCYFFRDSWVKFFKLDFFPNSVLDYFINVFMETMTLRELSREKSNDMIDIIIEMKNNDQFRKDAGFDGRIAGAQAMQIFLAGFETLSTTISFTLYELCLHQDVQNKLRKEILDNIKKHGALTYDGIYEMKYMDMCVSEVLRRYPVLPFIERKCTTDYKLPGGLVIEKGLFVYIPMYGLHFDEKYFPNPDKFDPERFAEGNPNSEGLVYLPFGQGPRNCIGERFGRMVTKLTVSYLIQNFVVEKSDATPVPVKFSTKSWKLESEVGLPMLMKNYVPLSD